MSKKSFYKGRQRLPCELTNYYSYYMEKGWEDELEQKPV